MKVLLIAINSKYSHRNIALYYLNNKIKDICECYTYNCNINDTLDHILHKICEFDADLLCFGCYIWNIEQTIKIAQSYHQIRPHAKIAFGGPEVSYHPQDVLNTYPFVSSIMCGESEENIVQLVNDLQNNCLQKTYTLPVSIEQIPSIAEDIIKDDDGRVVYFETSRGCPFRCSYCLSCIDKQIKYFPMEQIKTDLQKLLDNNVKQIRFLDRTFNSDRIRAIEIWKFLIEKRKDTTFHFEICANLINDETLAFLKSVPKDIFQFEIGIQSTNQKTLEAIQRHDHFHYERKILEKLHAFGNIKLHTDLIVGLPYEDLASFIHSFNELYVLHPNEIQIGFLKFLKGTDIYTTIDEHAYKFHQFPPYEVLKNKYISYEEIQYLKKLETVFELLYNSTLFTTTLTVIENLYSTPFDLYKELIAYFDEKQLFDRKVSFDEIFTHLSSLYIQNPLYSTIQQALTYDYFLHFKGTREWMYQSNTNSKDIINTFIQANRSNLFYNLNNSQILKEYQFLVLDFDFETMKKTKNKIYYHKKLSI